jgi:hypothetical protein
MFRFLKGNCPKILMRVNNSLISTIHFDQFSSL